MSAANTIPRWETTPPAAVSPCLVSPEQRLEHVRYCSPFAASLLDQHPDWGHGLDVHRPPNHADLAAGIAQFGLDPGLRHFRNRHMLRIIWRDLCLLSTLDETFADLTALAEVCLSAAIAENRSLLQEKFGTPFDEEGREQHLCVIGLGKFGGGELNLSSDIDIVFFRDGPGECRGGSRRAFSSEEFFTRLAQAVISSLSDVTEDGFCFRVDTRLRPFGDSGPLCPSLSALEQYYQREGRDWERYALIKARPVAGDPSLGAELMQLVRPFVYRRYIDFTAIEALQDMHASVIEDARHKDRLDDIKRGPGGIREIEFLVQCFQLLRGGRQTELQTSSLLDSLAAIESLSLLDATALGEIRQDYIYLRRMENRIQALRDQQTHSLPAEPDLSRLAHAMGDANANFMQQKLEAVRNKVTQRFQLIFPAQAALRAEPVWIDAWRHLQEDRQGGRAESEISDEKSNAEKSNDDRPMSVFLRSLGRQALSQRARRRLDQFMPVLLHRLDSRNLDDQCQHRLFDLVLSISQRSAYLVLLVQNAPALDHLIDLFARSDWVASCVIRFPALLDELIDPSLGRMIPGPAELRQSVSRLKTASAETETILAGLNYLKLATALRIAVAQLDGSIDYAAAQKGLAELASALLQGVLDLATMEIQARHGRMPRAPGSLDEPKKTAAVGSTPNSAPNSLALVAYGSLGALEPGYESDLDLVFLFDGNEGSSDGERSLPAERYYARLAQRMLSFLTVATASGRLYAVDTRLRPNGRAGSLVSSVDGFANYQRESAWTWELQSLTRARSVAGNVETSELFAHLRQGVLEQPRDTESLRTDLRDMRARMAQEFGGAGALVAAAPFAESQSAETGAGLHKHQPGGLVDIGFIVQFGVLSQASSFPGRFSSTSTLELMHELVDIGWLTPADAGVLEKTLRELHQQRMLETLAPGEHLQRIDSTAAAAIFERLFGAISRTRE